MFNNENDKFDVINVRYETQRKEFKINLFGNGKSYFL